MIQKRTCAVDGKGVIYVKVCPTCLNQFYTHCERQRYCSDICRRKDRTKKSLRKVVCPVCGKEFTPAGSRQECCSVECARKKLHAGTERTCAVCGKSFLGDFRQKCCSKECKLELRRQLRAKYALAARIKSGKFNDEGAISKTCPECGKEFQTTKLNVKYCSPECSRNVKKRFLRELQHKMRLADREEREKIKRICQHCGKEFYDGDFRKKFCSLKCADKHFKEYRSNYLREYKKEHGHSQKDAGVQFKKRICVYCGKEFRPSNPCQQLCSDECRAERKRQQWKECSQRRRDRRRGIYKPPTRVCIVCGKPFQSFRTHKKICSDECAKEQQRRKSREYERRRRLCLYEAGYVTTMPDWYTDGTENPQKEEPVKRERRKAKKETLAAPKPKPLRKCFHCGKEFTPEHGFEKVCSEECRFETAKKFAGLVNLMPNLLDGIIKKKVKRESKVNDYTREAEICGMSYGYYVAARKSGKSFDQLRPADWRERLAKIEARANFKE